MARNEVSSATSPHRKIKCWLGRGVHKKHCVRSRTWGTCRGSRNAQYQHPIFVHCYVLKHFGGMVTKTDIVSPFSKLQVILLCHRKDIE